MSRARIRGIEENPGSSLTEVGYLEAGATGDGEPRHICEGHLHHDELVRRKDDQ